MILQKFLILSGALKFIINGYEVNVVGGDFLMIPPSKYIAWRVKLCFVSLFIPLTL